MRKKTAPVELLRPEVDTRHGFPGKIPQKEKQQVFLIEFAKAGDRKAAAKAAGYSEAWAKGNGTLLVKQYQDYVTWLQASRAQALVQEVSVDTKMVLDEMTRIAFANEYDYLVFFEKPEKDAHGKETGKNVPTARRKYVHELTREQMAAVVVFNRGDHGIDWRWRDRDGKLYELGKHLGMFNEKIIMEHRHRHLHAHFDLTRASMQELEALEAQFEELLMIEDGSAKK